MSPLQTILGRQSCYNVRKLRDPTIPVVCLRCNEIYDRITHSPIGAELDRSFEECDSEEFIPWDYKAKKCPKCKDGIIGESDWGVRIMAD